MHACFSHASRSTLCLSGRKARQVDTHLLRGMPCISHGRSHRVSICKKVHVSVDMWRSLFRSLFGKRCAPHAASGDGWDPKKKDSKKRTHPVTNTVFSRWVVDILPAWSRFRAVMRCVYHDTQKQMMVARRSRDKMSLRCGVQSMRSTFVL